MRGMSGTQSLWPTRVRRPRRGPRLSVLEGRGILLAETPRTAPSPNAWDLPLADSAGPAGSCLLSNGACSRPRVVIVSGSVGAGHDGAAFELARRLEQAGVAAAVVDYLTFLPRWVARLLDEGYTASVQRVPALFGWIFRHLEARGLTFAVASGVCRLSERRLLTAVRNADVVVSTYPLASRSLGELKRRELIDIPCVSFLTDPAPHRMWVHPSLDQHLTVTAQTSAEGQARYQVPMTTAGPLVPLRFSLPHPHESRAALRRSLGVEPQEIAVLISAGSLGLGQVQATAAAVRHAGGVPIVLCGRNTVLLQRLTQAGHRGLSWREDIAELMAAADVLVHNAGGLSLTEALVAGLPAITFAPIPGHGRANAELLDRTGLVPWATSTAQLRSLLLQSHARPRSPLAFAGPDVTDCVLAWLTVKRLPAAASTARAS